VQHSLCFFCPASTGAVSEAHSEFLWCTHSAGRVTGEAEGRALGAQAGFDVGVLFVPGYGCASSQRQTDSSPTGLRC
jgi:hypothetical protein